MAKPQIAVIVGSNRRESINRKLAQALVKLGAAKFDANFVRIDDLPMFNQDLRSQPAGRSRALQGRDHARRRRAHRDAGTRPLHSGGAEKRHRLGRAAFRQERVARQARFHHRHVGRRHRHRAGAAAFALGHDRARHDSARRRGLRHVQAEPDRRARQDRRREHAKPSCRALSTASPRWWRGCRRQRSAPRRHNRKRRHCEEPCDEAIQDFGLDCFVALATTITSPPARARWRPRRCARLRPGRPAASG